MAMFLKDHFVFPVLGILKLKSSRFAIFSVGL